MTVATELIQNYRLALRDLWNLHFWRDQGYRDWESVKDFERAQLPLFRGLVARRLEPLGEPCQFVFGSSYQVAPSLTTERLPTMMVESSKSIWEQLPGPFSANQLKLTIIDFFDWNVRHWRDFRYYRVKIEALEGRPELVGHDGLVDVLDAAVLWNAERDLAV